MWGGVWTEWKEGKEQEATESQSSEIIHYPLEQDSWEGPFGPPAKNLKHERGWNVVFHEENQACSNKAEVRLGIAFCLTGYEWGLIVATGPSRAPVGEKDKKRKRGTVPSANEGGFSMR